MGKRENINKILKEVRRRIKASKGPLKSIDPKKQQRALEDIAIAEEVKKSIQEPPPKNTDDK